MTQIEIALDSVINASPDVTADKVLAIVRRGLAPCRRNLIEQPALDETALAVRASADGQLK